mmetsp:Transcript_22536/g.53245  ORF Transcript_22536/g.53245 Transcript_22536/m.53245 type:complete len:1016 (-) Transcript_22536:116-3163(-)
MTTTTGISSTSANNNGHSNNKHSEQLSPSSESSGSAASASLNGGGHHFPNPKSNGISSSSSPSPPSVGRMIARWLGGLFRLCFLDLPLVGLFAIVVTSMTIHEIHDKYLFPQGKLMQFHPIRRDLTDTSYYHRVCTAEDVTATTFDELYVDRNVDWNTTSVKQIKDKAVESILTHGAVAFEQLISRETAEAAHQFIAKANHIIPSWFILKQEHRYSWGIDLDYHWSLRKLWTELGENDVFRESLEAIVGPDPAVIEFTAITAEYGAVSQHDHADVDSSSSPVKYARSFYPAYSLFIPLQDTTLEMGATEICPGTHVCADGASTHCPQEGLNVVASGSDNLWRQGSGFIFNQQLNHKGMQHVQEGGRPRVVLILTFTPRPQTPRRGRLETRLIPQGMSYSLLWTHWGHTFSDFVNADTRMKEPFRTMRSIGLLPSRGINMITSATSRIVNEDSGYDYGYLEEFIDEGGFPLVPGSWQKPISKDYYEELFPGENYNELTHWHAFLLGTLTNIERETKTLYMYAVAALLALSVLVDLFKRVYFGNLKSGSFFFRSMKRIVISHGLVILSSWAILRKIDGTPWAKSIKSEKAYRLPLMDRNANITFPPSTLPDKRDILIAPHMAATFLGSYGRVLEYAHPGNKFWKETTTMYADGYSKLPSKELQNNFCNSLIEWVLTEHRFLVQDEERYWSAVDTDNLVDFCHRAVLRRSDAVIDDILREVDSLDSETEFGLFRGTAMEKTTIPKVLDDIERLIMSRVESPKSSSKLPLPASSTSKKTGQSQLEPNPQWDLSKTLEGSSFSRSYRQQRSALPPSPSRKEPAFGAWLEEGDIVEVMQECRYNEWYKGRVIAANPYDRGMAVAFVDGDAQNDLEPDCIRPHIPYVVGDEVQITSMQNTKGTILEISTSYNEELEIEEPTFVLSLDDGGTTGEGETKNETVSIFESEVSRYLPGANDVTFHEGMKVYARAKGNHPFSKGVLLEEPQPGRWEVMFLRGDAASGELYRTVPSENILCAMDCDE